MCVYIYYIYIYIMYIYIYVCVYTSIFIYIICVCVCHRKGKYMRYSTSKVMELEPRLVGDVFFWRFTS